MTRSFPFFQNAHVNGFDVGGTQNAFNLPWTPTVGNLILIYLFYGNGASPLPAGTPTFASGWNLFTSVAGFSGIACFGVYHYVASGEGLPLAPLLSSGVGYVSYAPVIIELAGVTGVFANDHVGSQTKFQQNTSPFVAPSGVVGPNGIVVSVFGEYGSTANTTGASGWSMLTGMENNLAWGIVHAYANFYPSGGIASGTLTPGIAGSNQFYIQSTFAALSVPPSPPTVETVYFRRPEPTNGHSVRSW